MFISVYSCMPLIAYLGIYNKTCMLCLVAPPFGGYFANSPSPSDENNVVTADGTEVDDFDSPTGACLTSNMNAGQVEASDLRAMSTSQ